MVYLKTDVTNNSVAYKQEDSRFTCTSLTVCKKRTVVSFDNFVEHRIHNVLVYHRLVGLGAKDKIEGVLARAIEIDKAQAARG